MDRWTCNNCGENFNLWSSAYCMVHRCVDGRLLYANEDLTKISSKTNNMKVRIKATGKIVEAKGVWDTSGDYYFGEVEFLPEEETTEAGPQNSHSAHFTSEKSLHKEQKEDDSGMGAAGPEPLHEELPESVYDKVEPLHQGQTIEEMPVEEIKLRIAFNDGKMEGLKEGLESLNRMSEVFDRFNREVRNKV